MGYDCTELAKADNDSSDRPREVGQVTIRL
jgi:hypothetical protein